jgi:hypothetical protein
LTYWLNRIQKLKTKNDVFVSIFPRDGFSGYMPDEKHILHKVDWDHPKLLADGLPEGYHQCSYFQIRIEKLVTNTITFAFLTSSHFVFMFDMCIDSTCIQRYSERRGYQPLWSLAWARVS